MNALIAMQAELKAAKNRTGMIAFTAENGMLAVSAKQGLFRVEAVKKAGKGGKCSVHPITEYVSAAEASDFLNGFGR